MAYSIFIEFQTTILESSNEWIQNYFLEQPWAKNPDDGKILIWIKPRYETNHLDRFIPFMEAALDCKSHIISIDDDGQDERKKLIPLMKNNGFNNLIPLVQFREN